MAQHRSSIRYISLYTLVSTEGPSRLKRSSRYLAAVLTSLSPRPLRLTTMRVPSGSVGHSFYTQGKPHSPEICAN